VRGPEKLGAVGLWGGLRSPREGLHASDARVLFCARASVCCLLKVTSLKTDLDGLLLLCPFLVLAVSRPAAMGNRTSAPMRRSDQEKGGKEEDVFELS
jgi:hypothetical protein